MICEGCVQACNQLEVEIKGTLAGVVNSAKFLGVVALRGHASLRTCIRRAHCPTLRVIECSASFLNEQWGAEQLNLFSECCYIQHCRVLNDPTHYAPFLPCFSNGVNIEVWLGLHS